MISWSQFRGKPPKANFSGLFICAWTSSERMKSHYTFLGKEGSNKKLHSTLLVPLISTYIKSYITTQNYMGEMKRMNDSKNPIAFNVPWHHNTQRLVTSHIQKPGRCGNVTSLIMLYSKLVIKIVRFESAVRVKLSRDGTTCFNTQFTLI